VESKAVVKILILSQFFDPEPALKNIAFAKALAADGHDVRVLTGFPNYPGGKVYGGYRIRWRQREVIDGITITRVPLYPSHSRSRIGRIANYGSFAASASLAALFSRWRPDVVYTYHPPLTVGLAASLISVLRGVPFVYDIQDLWPDTLAATGMIGNPRLLRFIGVLAAAVYRRAGLLMPQSPGFAQRLRAVGVPERKIRVVYNWCDEAALDDAGTWTRPAALAGKFLVTFAGTMGAGQGLDAVLDAAALLQAAQPDVRFLFIGGGIERSRLEGVARARNLTNTLFLPPVPMQQIGAVLQAADALLVHLRDDPLFSITIPSKTQAYLFAGKPIIMAVRGDAAALVRRAEAGIIVPPEDAEAIAAAVISLARTPATERKAMGARGRAFYEAELSFDVGVRAVLSTLKAAAGN
jgi:colanic acid biosynthesis glycosyl transferase WcaI